MLGAVHEARARRRGSQGHVGRHREVAVEALAHLDALDTRGDDIAKPPHGHAAPSFLRGGKELPVGHRVAEGAVGHVVRAEAEAIDAQLDLTSADGVRVLLAGRDPRRPQIVAPNLEVRHGTNPRSAQQPDGVGRAPVLARDANGE